MANWKEVALTDNVPNLGNTDLTSTDNARTLNLKQVGTSNQTKFFRVRGVTSTGVTASDPALEIKSLNTSDTSVAPTTQLEFSGTSMAFDATGDLGTMLFNSSALWGCISPTPYFICDSFLIRNTDDGASENPVLKLERYPSTSAGGNSDLLGVIEFRGEDAGGIKTTYASLNASIVDATNTTEDGELDIQLINAGSMATALKIKPLGTESSINLLSSIEVYENTLKSLLIGFQKYSLKTSYKMYLNPQHYYGFQPLHGYIMSLIPGNDGQQNPSYIIEPDDIAAFTAGTATLDGVAGDALSSFQDSENVGYGDAWLTYDQAADAPAVTIELSGHVWWKPRMDPPSGQSLSFWFAHEDIADGFVDDINEDTGVQFVFKGETSTFTLSDGEEVTKMPFSFSHNLTAANGNAKQHMFLLGSEIKSVGDVDYIGQATTTESVNYNNMVADVTMRVYPQ